MTKKLESILTDTVVIIGAHEMNLFNPLTNVYRICIPETVLRQEAFYYSTDKGKKALNPTEWIKAKKAFSIEAEPCDYLRLTQMITEDCLSGLDQGELEALALLVSGKNKEMLFTTCDKAAIKVMGVLGLSQNAISFEKLLTRKRIPHKPLPYQYTEKFFKYYLDLGYQERDLYNLK